MKEVRCFYCPDVKEVCCLPEDEAAHALRVLRMKEGDAIVLIDGEGSFYEAQITRTSRGRCFFNIMSEIPQEPLWKGHLHLAVAPTKNVERIEWLAEKATEIGLDELSFLNCQLSERRSIKRERIERIVISAMKQSHKARKPRVNEICDFDSFVRMPFQGDKYIAHCYSETALCPNGKPYLLDVLEQSSNDILVMIGPEGDFSSEEVQTAIQQGFLPVSLGDSRLRTETAGLVALHLMTINNRIYSQCKP